MTEAIGQILPLAIAVALSTIPILSAILILLSDAKPLVSVMLLIGWAVGMFLVLAVLTIGFGLVPTSFRRRDDTAVGVIRILLGSALLVYPIVTWRRRHRRQPSESPRWMSALDRINAWGALGFGGALALRPKNLILSVAGAVVIRDASLRAGDAVVVIVVFTLVGVSTVALPIIGYLLAPEKARNPLEATRKWIIANSDALMLGVALMAGAVIIGSGLTKL
ncbi:GAP family protein [Mycetocola sp. 2940]|uniref:GAP family protein n=1 Tax=Mycetocola sp. 2940 TaxID=3156452 RepID=UPI0033976662